MGVAAGQLAAGGPAFFMGKTLVELRFMGVVGIFAHNAVDDVRPG
jgi:hypothetical protein